MDACGPGQDVHRRPTFSVGRRNLGESVFRAEADHPRESRRVYTARSQNREINAVAIKQLCASHYFHTALDLSVCVVVKGRRGQDPRVARRRARVHQENDRTVREGFRALNARCVPMRWQTAALWQPRLDHRNPYQQFVRTLRAPAVVPAVHRWREERRRCREWI